MIVITRDQVKTYLGITDSSLDAKIDQYIPIIDAKVKQVCNNRFNSFFKGDVDSTVYLEVYDFKGETIEVGAQIEGQNIPTGTYIKDVYYDGESLEVGDKRYLNTVIKLSQAATATEVGIQFWLGINIAYHPLIAKGVSWLIDQENTTEPTKSLSSRSMGPVSVGFNTKDSEIDNRYGMPSWFVKGLPKYHGGF